ncbi:MAG: energy-coupling factor transporter transmembrane protein EcfT [Clostridia bacterium]|nr:energy-coupling factor transporter transmembrane protein EcfT [Clostridia bacterium]
MRNDVAFGQYYPTKSFVHRMDPRMKILLLIAYIVLIFIVRSFYGFAVVGGLLCLMVLFSRVPILKVVRSIRAILFIIIITVIINLFLHREDDDTVIFSWWVLSITDSSWKFAAFMALRLVLLVLGSSVLTLTTTPVALTDGLESLMSPLKLIKFPVHELALVMSIALRFIPTLMEETERIISAQKARGAAFDTGGLFSRIKALIPVLIPLIISAFKRADELGDAMEARCYAGSKTRTKYKKLKMGVNDVIGALFVAASLAGVIVLNVYTVALI